MRKFILATLAASLVIAVSSQTHRLSAEPDSKNSVVSTRAAPDSLSDGELIVHEWGTFTTFSGSDGVFMDFRPLAAQHSDLPAYVLDRGAYSSGRNFSKSRLWGRVRMETPVTYFYTDRIRTIDVRVDFPSGLLTEFYPPVKSLRPPIDEKNIFGKGELIGDSSLDWGKVDLIPLQQLIPNVTSPEMREQLISDVVKGLLPSGPNEQHYAAARETDSALVHVHGKSGLNLQDQGFFEKFLFYRGVGKFQLPISARFESADIVISNNGKLPLNSAILIDVDGKTIKAAKLDRVAAGQSLTFEQLAQVDMPQLVAMVEASLVGEGLYQKEAASMVKTWQQSWFTENGTRILYMVPAPITDELLPLQITPRPEETLRVLVGRMEIMSPEAEKQMIGAVAQSIEERAKHNADQAGDAKKMPYTIPARIRDFGRMAEPALARVAKLSADDAVRREAQSLVAQFQN